MFSSIKKLHFVGIGGIGMSGIAEVLLNLGYKVSGSDLRQSETTERLALLGGDIYIGHARENLSNVDVVVTSTAVQADNPEVLAGLTAHGAAWAFTTSREANWHPLTWLSLMLDAEIGGGEPRAFHLPHDELDALLLGQEGRLRGVRDHSDDQPVEETGAARDDVQVPARDGVEGPREDRRALRAPAPACRSVDPDDRRWRRARRAARSRCRR